jgi:hypothetical protein
MAAGGNTKDRANYCRPRCHNNITTRGRISHLEVIHMAG